MKLDLGKIGTTPVQLDLELLLKTRMLITASSGGGKTETIRRLVEEAFGKVQIIIIDPEGEFSTLREKFGFVLVGKGGETPADVRSASLVATTLLEIQASAVCDIFEMKPHERHEWVKRFLDSMIDAPKELWHPVLVVIDEAHLLAPEKGQGESAAYGSVIDLCSRGRKRGFCAVLATQRLSKLSKNAAAELQNTLVGRTTHVDQERAADIFKIENSAKKQFFRDLEMLNDGEFFARGRAFGDKTLRFLVTRASTRSPEVGTAKAAITPPAPASIRHLLPKLADLPQEAEKKAKSEADLRAEIVQLKRQLTAAQSGNPANEAKLTKEANEYRSKLAELWARFENERRDFITKLMTIEDLADHIKSLTKGEIGPRPKASTPKQDLPPAKVLLAKNIIFVPAKTTTPKPEKKAADGEALTGPEQRIIDAIAWLESIGVEQPEQPAVAFLAGYSYGGGGYNNPRGRLNQRRLLEYVPGDRIALTDAGREVANFPDGALTNDQLHERVLSRLPGPEQRLLRPLLEAYPNGMSHEDLAQAANYASGSGGFNNPRGRLRTLGLIEYRGGTSVARDLLFPEGA